MIDAGAITHEQVAAAVQYVGNRGLVAHILMGDSRSPQMVTRTTRLSNGERRETIASSPEHIIAQGGLSAPPDNISELLAATSGEWSEVQ